MLTLAKPQSKSGKVQKHNRCIICTDWRGYPASPIQIYRIGRATPPPRIHPSGTNSCALRAHTNPQKQRRSTAASMHGGHIVCTCNVMEWICYIMLYGAPAGQSLTQKSDLRLRPCLHGGGRAGGALHAPPETDKRRAGPAKKMPRYVIYS